MPYYYVELKRDERIDYNVGGPGMLSKTLAAGIYRVERRPFSMDDGTLGENLLLSMPTQMAHSAERVWLEMNNKITYVKNRFDHNNVDMEEFTWIKLSAKELVL